MPRLLQRRLRCFYCNGVARNDQAGIPRSFHCPHCEAVNHLDQYGRITDPPAQATTPERAPPVQYARELSGSLVMAPSTQSPFCDNCQRNQTIVNNAMAEYIPDEDDPDYDRHVATANAYRAELETRYPQVCEDCIGQVHDHIRAAGYAAKVDNLRRKLEDSKKRKLEYNTSSQIWTLRGILLAKWVYIFSTSVALLWHASGLVAASDYAASSSEELAFCVPRLLHNFVEQHHDTICLSPASSLKLLRWCLVGDIVTIWWNPRLKQMVTRPGRRMRGLVPVWLVRLLTLVLRAASNYWWHDPLEGNKDSQLILFEHGAMLVWLLVSLTISLRAVRIEYISTASLAQPLEPHLPNIPSRPTSQEQEYRPIRPKADVYDSMAQSFTSSFGGPNEAQPSSHLPPSPSLTATTVSIDSENLTPYVPKVARLSEEDMDWTPTRNRFGKQSIGIQPPIWTTGAETHNSKPKHSLFSQPDPNPFRHKVPAFPKHTLQDKRDPWKSKLWAPAAEETKKTFLSDVMQKGADADLRQRLQQDGVPKTVKKDEELFQKPQLKYDYQGYVGERSTGLEDTFNDLFAN